MDIDNDATQNMYVVPSSISVNVQEDIEQNGTKLKVADLDGFELSFIDFKPCSHNQQVHDFALDIDTTYIDDELPYRRSEYSRHTHRRQKKSMPRRLIAHPRERHVIQHNYHDHAMDVTNIEETIGLDAPIKKKGGVAVPFPLKLHELLEKVEEEGQQHIVSWQPHGRAFVVREPKTFVADLMPRFFRQTKLTSFQRQLNLYGFSRLTRGADAGGYYHELFLRGKPYLTRRMIRTKIKGTGYKAASNPSCEPDFYSMAHVGPVVDSRPECISPCTSDRKNDHIPVVTPHTTFASPLDCTHSQLQYMSGDMFGTGNDDVDIRDTFTKSYLKPRHHSKTVQIENEHFYSMKSLNHEHDIDSKLFDNDRSSSRTRRSPSPSLSPVSFKRIPSEEISNAGQQISGDMFGTGNDDVNIRDPFTTSYLKPRHHSKSVQIGNEHFHYMESLNHAPGIDSKLFHDDRSSSRTSRSPSPSPSPSLSPVSFKRISSEEISNEDHNENIDGIDPLSIFLKEMGGIFDDDLVFTSNMEGKGRGENQVITQAVYEV